MTNAHSHRGAADAGMVTTPKRLSVLLCYHRSDRATQTNPRHKGPPDDARRGRNEPPCSSCPRRRPGRLHRTGGPTLICFDGSEEARRAVSAAADLLAPRDAILASFLAPVDDLALLRTTLPWSPSATTPRRLARLDRQEAEFLTQLSTEGAALAGRRGLRSRPLAIEGPGSASDRLLDVAATARGSCIVVGHRSAATPLDSTGLARHADRPVLVVPR